MAIEKIDPELCSGCGMCVDSCSVDVIRLDEENQKAVIAYPEECMLCGFCVAVCPEDAIVLTPHKHSPLTMSWG